MLSGERRLRGLAHPIGEDLPVLRSHDVILDEVRCGRENATIIAAWRRMHALPGNVLMADYAAGLTAFCATASTRSGVIWPQPLR
jgi:hypothetical protein